MQGDEVLALAIGPIGEQVDRVWAPPSISSAEEKRGELEVGGVALSPVQAVGSLMVDTRLVCVLKVDVVLEGDCPQLAGNH